MQTHIRAESLRASMQAVRCMGRKVALVPTMGNLHDGHLALVKRAKELADITVVSIYVNPMQFAPGEDFARYPRTLSEDLSALARCGVDAAFTPSDEEMYPGGANSVTRVEVTGRLSEDFCGAQRPGHFAGVATAVVKLLFIAMPDVAVFGEKDYQQLAVVRRLAADLCCGTRIVGVPTVRDEDQLALSSRNHYLSPAQRRIAPALHRCLQETAERLQRGERDCAALERDGLDALRRSGIAPNYYRIADADSLGPGSVDSARLVVLVSGTIGNVHLIDNVTVLR